MAGLSRKRLVPLVAGGAALIAVSAGGVVWWTNKQKYERTDNAFVQADKAPISSLVEGYVAEVLVEDNQPVQPGQLLVRIDPATIRARLAEAEAKAAALEAAVDQVDDKARLEQALIAQKAAGVQSAKAQAQFAASELERYGALSRQGWVSSQRAQTARTAQQQAQAGVAEAQAALEAERRAAASLGSARAQTLTNRVCLDKREKDCQTLLRRPASAVHATSVSPSVHW